MFGLLVATAACGPQNGFTAVPGGEAPTPSSSAYIPLLANRGDKTGYHVQLSIAGTAARGFLFDTGSGGLWVYANTIAHPRDKVRRLGIKASNQYASGLRYEGEAVETTVDFGNGLPVETVPLVRVAKAYCLTESCKKKYGDGDVTKRLERERGLWGTFGADLEPRPISQGKHTADLYNILFGLGRAWTSFAIVPSKLESSAAMSEFTKIQMTPGPVTYRALPNGAKSWSRDVRVCYEVFDPAAKFSSCLPTVFDTGASGVEFRSVASEKLPSQETSYCGTLLEAGKTFAAETSGLLLASFASGITQNWNEVRLVTPSPTTSPQVNTGLTFYNRNVIAFDAVHGVVGLKALHPPMHRFEMDCR